MRANRNTGRRSNALTHKRGGSLRRSLPSDEVKAIVSVWAVEALQQRTRGSIEYRWFAEEAGGNTQTHLHLQSERTLVEIHFVVCDSIFELIPLK